MNTSTATQPRQAGHIDDSFGTDGRISPTLPNELGRTLTMALSSDGSITHASELYGKMLIARALVDGAEDLSFTKQQWNFVEGDNSRPNRLLLQKLANSEQDERVVVIGESLVKDSTGNPVYRPAVMRLLANGSPDLVFGRSILPQPDDYKPEYGFPHPTSDGCLQRDDKILVTATYDAGFLNQNHSRLYCLTRTGELDNQFGQGGFIEMRLHDKPSLVCAVQTQSDGNIIVAGTSQSGLVTLARYSPSGVLDETFGDEGFVDLPNEPTSENDIYATTSINNPSRLLVMKDDRIVFTGYRRIGAKPQGLVMRLLADGARDSSFNGGEPVYLGLDSMDVELATVAVQPDGKIVTAGRGVNRDLPLNQIYAHKWRLLDNGNLDPTFNSESLSGEFSDIAIQASGRILLAGSSGFAWSARFPVITAFKGQ